VLALATIRNPVRPAAHDPSRAHPQDAEDPALRCAACPVLTPHIKPR
jgi:hypothetical protein